MLELKRLRKCIRFGFLPLLLFFYVALVFSNFTNNEFEEQYNSSMSSYKKYQDFDGDGTFDLDQEDDEDSGRQFAKSLFSDHVLSTPIIEFQKEFKKTISPPKQWTLQHVHPEFFQPPKA